MRFESKTSGFLVGLKWSELFLKVVWTRKDTEDAFQVPGD